MPRFKFAGAFSRAPPMKEVQVDAITVQVGDQIAFPSGEISPGTTMQFNQWAMSPNGLYVLIMQGDGNLVLYQVDGAPPMSNSSFQGYPIWASQTDYGIPLVFDVQTDGNLVIYDETDGSNKVMWASNTQNSSPAYLAVQDDGNVVYYDTSGNAFWATNSSVWMPGIVPTLSDGAIGRFDFKNVAWRNANNEGDNGSVPTVSLNSNSFTVSGGFQWQDHEIGSGQGSINIQVSLMPATCSVTAQIAGRPFGEFSFSGSGSWQLTSGDEPVLTCTLADGTVMTISTFDGGGIWYPGVEVDYSAEPAGFELCFENMSSASAAVVAAQEARESPLRRAV